MNTTVITITTARGLERRLIEEVRALGLPVTWAGALGVKTEGSLLDAMKLNLHLRSGHRVLLLLDRFQCSHIDDLYRAAERIPWETIIPADGYVSVTSNVVNETVTDGRFASLRCKDAIVDRIRRRRGRRPDSGSDRHGAVVDCFWRGNNVELYLDTSGEPLSKRGYRAIPLGAPMQETLAAAVLETAGWSGNGNCINPMCGSGTIAIEAALIAIRRAPGLLRPSFGFMHSLLFDKKAWARLRDEARALEVPFSGAIVATDIDRGAISASRKNARAAGVEPLIEFETCDFADTPLPEGGGIVLLNPEYGFRMGDAKNLSAEYRQIGDFLKQKCRGYTGFVFTGATTLAGRIGLKARKKYSFWSGKLECRLYEYDLYSAKKAPTNT